VFITQLLVSKRRGLGLASEVVKGGNFTEALHRSRQGYVYCRNPEKLLADGLKEQVLPSKCKLKFFGKICFFNFRTSSGDVCCFVKPE
jgi:hypothetical protein